MRLFDPMRLVSGTLIAVVLAACEGGHGSAVTPTVSSSSAREDAAQARSTLPRQTSGQDLLYVAVNTPPNGRVFVYTYPQGKLLQKLSGFSRPAGECMDSAGDVFITSLANYSSFSSTIFEYAHGSETPIAELNDPGFASSCTVDPMSGNLAVSNSYDVSNPYNPHLGSIAIYTGAQGNPTIYYSRKFATGACGYDDHGNLYLAGGTLSSNQWLLVRLGKGASHLQRVSLDQKVYGDGLFSPSVQWDGQHMTISSVVGTRRSRNRGSVAVYQLSISGSQAKVIGTTKLVALRPNMHGGQSWIQGNAIVGIDYRNNEGWVSYWAYPKGGEPTHNIRNIVPLNQGQLTGLTISVASSH
jgi:hypothetical protein